MLFVNKFCSRLKYYKITHDIPDFVFKSICLFDMNPEKFACSKSTIRTKFETCSQLTINTLERPHLHCSSVFILNLDQI